MDEINGQWSEPFRRECGAFRQQRVADGILIQICHRTLGHEGDHDPFAYTTTATPLTSLTVHQPV